MVTGAGRGIGRAMALKFAAAGADVVCVSRTAENSEKVAAEVRALGRQAWAFAVDVADVAAVAAAFCKNVSMSSRFVVVDGSPLAVSDLRQCRSDRSQSTVSIGHWTRL